MNNGFGLLSNWSRLGDGEHTVVAWVDGVELGRATVQGATLGVEFVHRATDACEVKDFPHLVLVYFEIFTLTETVTYSPNCTSTPHLEQSVLLEWQQNGQNFVTKNMA